MGVNKNHATVDDIIKALQKVSDEGNGDYVVFCEEYVVAIKNQVPVVDTEYKEVYF